MGRKQTKLVKSQPLLVERHHKLWIPRAASGLSLLGLSPWRCRERATLLSWSLRCPPPPGLLGAPRGSPAWGRGDSAALSPEGRTSCRDDAPQPAEHRLAFVPGDSRGDTRSWPGRSGPSGARPSGGREGTQGGRAGRVKADPAVAAFLGGRGRDPGGSLRHLCKRECAGGWGRHTQDAHLARLCSGARSQEAEVKVKRCGGAAAPFARPDSLQELRAGPAAPPCPLSLLEQMCGDPC
ncbi:hypothetical protein NN561_003630 [Cricetulus griseus]